MMRSLAQIKITGTPGTGGMLLMRNEPVILRHEVYEEGRRNDVQQ